MTRSLLANREVIEKTIEPYVSQLDPNGYFIEIGIYRGVGMILWNRFFNKHKKDFTYIGVDPFLLAGDESSEEVRKEAYDNLDRMKARMSYINECKSDEFWETSYFDHNVVFIVIDGDHTDEFVKRDCEGAKATLAEKAIVVMDDIHCLSQEARKWVTEFWGEENIIHIQGDIEQYIILHGIKQ